MELLAILTTKNLLVSCFISSVFWFIWNVLRTWARLRHIPTVSPVAGFSYLWLAKTTYSGKQYWVHKDLHRKYGPLVRIGPNEITTNDPEIVKMMSASNSKYRRATWYLTGRFNPYHDNLFTILNNQVHREAKKRSLPAYLGKETPGIEGAINDQVVQFLSLLRQKYVNVPGQASKPLVNLGMLSNFFTMDVITRLAFGQETGYLRDEKDHYNFLDFVRRLWPRMSTSADVPWIRDVLFSRFVLRFLGPKPTDKTGFGALMGAAKEYVNRRFEAEEGKEGDMLAYFINHGFTREECEVQGLFLLLAGSESTANAIRAILIHAITSPHVYSKLKQEVALACKEGRVSYPITSLEARDLSFLQAVIFEGIRMRPPLLGLLSKVVPDEGDTLHGKLIPGGTSICTNISSILQSESLFGPDADIYRPERFTELDNIKRKEMEHNVELAFGYGQWACAGKTIAFMEMNKVIFEFFRAFDIQLINPLKPCDVESYGVFIEPNLFVKLSEDCQDSLVQA